MGPRWAESPTLQACQHLSTTTENLGAGDTTNTMRLLHTLCRFFVVLIAVRERAQGLLYVYAERSDLVRGATDFAFTYSRGIHTCRRTRSLSPPSLKSRVFRFDEQNLNYHPCRRNIPAVQAPAVNQKRRLFCRRAAAGYPSGSRDKRDRCFRHLLESRFASYPSLELLVPTTRLPSRARVCRAKEPYVCRVSTCRGTPLPAYPKKKTLSGGGTVTCNRVGVFVPVRLPVGCGSAFDKAQQQTWFFAVGGGGYRVGARGKLDDLLLAYRCPGVLGRHRRIKVVCSSGRWCLGERRGRRSNRETRWRRASHP